LQVKNLLNMTKRTQHLRLLLFFALLLVLVVISVHFLRPLFQPAMFRVVTCKCDFCKDAAAPIDSTGELNDLNDIQLEHAQIGGLKHPFDTDSDFQAALDSLLQNNILIYVEDCRYFKVDDLYHSHPYLVPAAVNLLKDIGVEFQKRLKKNHLKAYRFMITSMLRTDQSQHKLRRHNSNATTESAHCYGTTFDITYNQFWDGDDPVYLPKVRAIFTQTLIAMRQQCRFLIKREIHQSCFHMTVVVCKPGLADSTRITTP